MADLGSGTGMLSIAGLIYGLKQSIAIEVD